VPEAKGAPSPVTADQIKKADAAADKEPEPKGDVPKTTESPKQTGAGEGDPGNQPEDKPKNPDVVPTKKGGQNE